MYRPGGRSLLLSLLLATGLGVLLERLIVTDTEAIEALLEQGLSAARERRLSDLRPLLSDDFTWEGRGPDATVESLQRLVTRHAPTRIDADWGPIVVARDRAEVEVRVRAWAYGGAYPVTVATRWIRESGGWRLLEVLGRGP